MKEIINVFKSIDALEKKIHEFEGGKRDPKVKDLFYEVYDKGNFDSWNEFDTYIKQQFRMMKYYATKFKDLSKITKEEFNEKHPEVRISELHATPINEDNYKTIDQILFYYNKNHRECIVEEMKEGKLRYWLTKGKAKKLYDDITPYQYYMGDVEKIIKKRKNLKEEVFLKDPAHYMSQLSGKKTVKKKSS